MSALYIHNERRQYQRCADRHLSRADLGIAALGAVVIAGSLQLTHRSASVGTWLSSSPEGVQHMSRLLLHVATSRHRDWQKHLFNPNPIGGRTHLSHLPSS